MADNTLRKKVISVIDPADANPSGDAIIRHEDGDRDIIVNSQALMENSVFFQVAFDPQRGFVESQPKPGLGFRRLCIVQTGSPENIEILLKILHGTIKRRSLRALDKEDLLEWGRIIDYYDLFNSRLMDAAADIFSSQFGWVRLGAEMDSLRFTRKYLPRFTAVIKLRRPAGTALSLGRTVLPSVVDEKAEEWRLGTDPRVDTAYKHRRALFTDIAGWIGFSADPTHQRLVLNHVYHPGYRERFCGNPTLRERDKKKKRFRCFRVDKSEEVQKKCKHEQLQQYAFGLMPSFQRAYTTYYDKKSVQELTDMLRDFADGKLGVPTKCICDKEKEYSLEDHIDCGMRSTVRRGIQEINERLNDVWEDVPDGSMYNGFDDNDGDEDEDDDDDDDDEDENTDQDGDTFMAGARGTSNIRGSNRRARPPRRTREVIRPWSALAGRLNRQIKLH